MTVYQPSELLIPTGLDELGFKFSLKRLKNESLASYRLRLLEEAKDPSGPTQLDYARTVSRQLGFLKQPLFDIDVIKDVNGIPFAANPYIEVLSDKIILYSDYNNNTIDMEIDLTKRGEGYFIGEVFDTINTSTYFQPGNASSFDYEFARSTKILYSHNLRYVERELLLETKSSKLQNTYIADFFADASPLFLEEKNSAALVNTEGDYYIDNLNGVLFTYSNQYGFCNYTYYKIPFTLYYAPVRFLPFNDPSFFLRSKDVLIDDNGQESKEVLNSYGAEKINSLLKMHPLSWGE